MIVLDTNIISELWKIKPEQNVIAWVDSQTVETLYLSAITVAELRFGIATIPKGKRKSIYEDRLENQVLAIFSDRILPFDLAASKTYSDLMARAQQNGLAIGKADGYIAAIALVNKMAVATRDTSPFLAAGLNVINPWYMGDDRG